MTESVREYLGEAVIEALRRPVLNDARGLPAKVYTDHQVPGDGERLAVSCHVDRCGVCLGCAAAWGRHAF